MRRRPWPLLAIVLAGLLFGVVPGTAAQTPDQPPADPTGLVAEWIDSLGEALGLWPTAPAPASTPPTADDDPPPLPRCRYRDRPTRYGEVRHWRMTLLDTTLRLPRDYEPTDLVSVRRAGIAGSGMVRKIVIEDLRALADAARAKGKPLAVRSAHRSYAVQEATFRSWVERAGYEQALLFSARPGHSEHQLGTAIDFTTAPGVPLSSSFGNSPPGKWLARNGWRYGFVMSYPKGKRRQSCYGYEPWHWRYVGRERAAEIEASGQVPRRYLWERFESVP
jgi:D-alanyl-D-alanine carboxypeptidase